MAYIDYEYYKSLFGEKTIPEADFNRLVWDSCKKIDNATTGVDNVKKLKIAFPTDEDDAEEVKRCICELLSITYKIEQAEARVEASQGYITLEDGTVMSKQVASKSAGNESISYVTSSNTGTATLIDKCLADKEAQKQLYSDTIRDYLSGVADANGVFMKDCKVNVLGTTYKIRFRHENEDEKLQELSGYCDYSNKTIVVAILEKSVDSVDNIESVQKSVLRLSYMKVV